MAATTEETTQSEGKGRKGLGLVGILLVLVVILCIAILGILYKVLTKPEPGSANAPAAAPVNYKLNQIPIVEEPKTTTNRRNQVLKWQAALTLRDDEKDTIKTEWSKPENRARLQDAVIEVIQDLDLSQTRPRPLDQFKSRVKLAVDALIGREDVVDQVIVTEWVAAAG